MDSVRVSDYIDEIFVEQDEVIRRVAEQTPQRGLPPIEICPDEGLFIQLLVRACRAKKALEIGTLGGYSGIWIARGLAEGGKLITLEKEVAHAQVAREHFSAAGLGGQVEVRVGDAHQILNTLAPESPFDFVFVDAEKSGYRAYFEEVLPLTRTGGLITFHNTLKGGRVLGMDAPDEGARLVDSFNRWVSKDSRVMSTIYPGGDGTLIALKLF